MSSLPYNNSTQYPFARLRDFYKRPSFTVFICADRNGANRKNICRFGAYLEFATRRKTQPLAVRFAPWLNTKIASPMQLLVFIALSFKPVAVSYAETPLRAELASFGVGGFAFIDSTAVLTGLFHATILTHWIDNRPMKSLASELSPGYFADGAAYCKQAELEMATPSLFDATEPEQEHIA